MKMCSHNQSSQPFTSNGAAPSYPRCQGTAIGAERTLTASWRCVIPSAAWAVGDVFLIRVMNTWCRALLFHRSCTRSRVWRGLWLLSCFIGVLWTPPQVDARSKPRAPRPEPELKILELKVMPNPYTVASGPLEFSTLVQLPKELNGATILEVSSLVTSPSKTSLRFLTTRKSVDPHTTMEGADPPSISLVLTWDGLDHKKQTAAVGTYAFEVRAKLLVNGEKGPRTMMVSWPKRGTLEVK